MQRVQDWFFHHHPIARQAMSLYLKRFATLSIAPRFRRVMGRALLADAASYACPRFNCLKIRLFSYLLASFDLENFLQSRLLYEYSVGGSQQQVADCAVAARRVSPIIKTHSFLPNA